MEYQIHLYLQYEVLKYYAKINGVGERWSR